MKCLYLSSFKEEEFEMWVLSVKKKKKGKTAARDRKGKERGEEPRRKCQCFDTFVMEFEL